MIRSLFAATLGLLLGNPALAQPRVPGYPHLDDPVGIVANPCPNHPRPEEEPARRIFDLQMRVSDFGGLCHYAADNRALAGQKQRVVFMGDSITYNWIRFDPALFTNGVIDRGIGGQTTSQMLVRFRQDVLALKPQAVHLMAGTNDIAGNSGPATMETVFGHIVSMAELARANGIKVIIASTPPAGAFSWSPAMRPAPQVIVLNRLLAAYARTHGFVYADYHALLATPDGSMRADYARDGVHPNAKGYAAMRPLASAAIQQVLGSR